MARNTFMYEIEVSHPGLNKYRHIRGSDHYVVKQKASMLQAQWNEEWNRKQEKERQIRGKQAEKNRIKQEKEDRQRTAEQLGLDAQAVIDQIQKTLLHTLNVNDAIDWNCLKDSRSYPYPKPTKTSLPSPTLFPIPKEPFSEDALISLNSTGFAIYLSPKNMPVFLRLKHYLHKIMHLGLQQKTIQKRSMLIDSKSMPVNSPKLKLSIKQMLTIMKQQKPLSKKSSATTMH